MTASNRAALLSVIAILVLLLSLTAPLTAFADEGTPTPESTPAETTESETPPEAEPTEAPVEPSAAPTEEPAADAEGESAPPAAEDSVPADEPVSVSEILEQAPEGTDLVVLDEQGAIVPLAEEEAAEILATGDPLWCPDGQAPTPGANGCSPGFTSMDDLLTYLASNEPGANGTIWIEDSYDSGVNDLAIPDFTIDGASLTTWSNYALTVQGGWNGAYNDSTITGTSEFNAALIVQNWGGNLTLNDLIFYDTGGSNSLNLQTSGDVSLGNVEAVDNGSGSGALIDALGTVTVDNSHFNGNSGDGLDVNSGEGVTLTDVYANANGGAGAELSTDTGLISVDGGTFNSNSESGLDVFAASGDIDIQNLDAQDNGDAGLNLYTEDGSVSVTNGVFGGNEDAGIFADADNGVSLQNVTVLNNQDGDGAYISAGGDVEVSDSVFVNNENGYGLNIDEAANVTLTDVLAAWNYYGGASIQEAASVTVTGGAFNNNFETGLEIYYIQGSISLTDVTAGGNDGYGADVYIEATGDLDIDGGTFNNNSDTGLYISLNDGSVTLSSVQANGNADNGADIDNSGGAGDLTIDDSEFNYNDDYGLTVYSAGNVSLDGVTAGGNFGNGAYIENTYGSGWVDVSNGEFNNNAGAGLEVYSGDDLTLSNVAASFNEDAGAILDSNGDTIITASAFNANSASGFEVNADGDLSLTGVSAGANGGYGGDLAVAGTITDSGSNYFNYNALNGTDCSDGVNNGINDPGSAGAWTYCFGPDTDVWYYSSSIEQHYLTLGQAIADITSGAFPMDDGILYIDAAFTPYLYDMNLDGADDATAGAGTDQLTQILGGGSSSTLIVGSMDLYNYSDGFLVDGLTFSEFIEAYDNAGTLTLSDVTTIGEGTSSYGNAGIDIHDHDGGIALDGVTASGISGGSGIYLDNTDSTAPGAITVTDSNFSGNGQDGLVAYAYGTITLTEVEGSFNWNSSGAYLYNYYGSSSESHAITVDGGNFSYNHDSHGLEAGTYGDITLTDVIANGNYYDGAYLFADGDTGSITVDGGEFSFNFNDEYGYYGGLEAYIYGDGYFQLEDITAVGNYASGAYLEHDGDNTDPFAPAASVVDGQFNYQYDGAGLEVSNYDADGGISLEDVTANGNYYGGAYLYISDGLSGGVSVVDSSFNYTQDSDGLEIDNYGSDDIYLSGVTADSNAYGGVYLYNDFNGDGSGTTAAGGVTVLDSSFSGNVYDTGLYVENYNEGGITLTDVTAGGNSDGGGAYLYNNSESYAVSVDPSVFNNNAGVGLEIYSAGEILLADITANNNGGAGAYLDNTLGDEDITISGTANVFNDNGYDGLAIYSNGAVDLSNVTASANQGYGVNVCNCSSGVTLSGVHVFNGNSLSGIYVDTPGVVDGSTAGISAGGNGSYGIEVYAGDAITLNNLTASYNRSTGALLDNTDGTAAILVNGSNTFNGNGSGTGDRGLDVGSNGAITVYDVTAGQDAYSGNSGAGVYLHNESGSPAAITIFGGSMQYNGTEGVYILSSGSVLLEDVYAEDNDEAGAFIENDFNTGYDVTVDTGSFSGNLLYDGLYVLSAGNVSILDVLANDNAGDGAYVDNSAGARDVFVDPSEFNENGVHGLEIYSAGNVDLLDLIANENGENGVFVDNTAGAGDVSVDPSLFNNNSEHGLEIISNGNIDLAVVTASYNTLNGAYLETTGDVSVSNSTFDWNTSDGENMGLEIDSEGDVTLNSVSASNNWYGDGADVYDFSTLTVQDSTFNDNYSTDDEWGWGLYVYGYGDVTLTNVIASGNGSDSYAGGVYVETDGNISIDPSEFNNSINGYGLELYAGGDILLSEVTADENDFDGAYIEADGDVTILCSQFTNNGGYGVDGSGVAGVLTFEDVTLTGNASGPFSGSPVFTSGPCALPSDDDGDGDGTPGGDSGIDLIPVTGGSATLDCSLSAGTTLRLPNGDSLTFLCPTRGDASAQTLGDDGLPGDLPDGLTFASSLNGAVTGGDSEPLPGQVIISFVIPDDLADSDLAILFWDGSAWVDLQGAAFDDGRVVFDGG